MKLTITIFVVLLLLLQYRLWFGDGNLVDVWHLQKTIATQQKENSKLRERNAALEAEVKDLKQGMQAVEERARRDLGMIKKGETFYQIVEQPPGDGSKTK